MPEAGKTLTVGPERLRRWLSGFEERHGPVTVEAGPEQVIVTASDGATAGCRVPFPPLEVREDRPYGGLVEHALRDRRVGVVLARRGGYAAGVFEGRRLVASKVGSRYVQGRTAAGGQSQQRFARRRDNQAREAFRAGADAVDRVVVPRLQGLEAIVLGGDARALDAVLADPRLAALRPLATGPRLNVPDPKLAVLRATPDQFRAVHIDLTEPAGPAEGAAAKVGRETRDPYCADTVTNPTLQ